MRLNTSQILFNLRRMFTTGNHPAVVAVEDAVLAGVASFTMQYLLLYIENLTLPSGYSVTMTLSDALFVAAIPAVMALAFGAFGSHTFRTRIYLQRSTRRTVLMTAGLMVVSTTVIWVGFGIFDLSSYDILSWLEIMSIFGFGLASAGYRIFGIVDPWGVAKLLKAGRTDEANAAVEAGYAAMGIEAILD